MKVRVTDNVGAQDTATDIVSMIPPISIDTAGSVGTYSSLLVVDGFPAISYFDDTNDDLRYVRATNSNGTAWSAPIAVDSTDAVGWYTSLAMVDGNPAISYHDNTNGDLKFVRLY